ncbi:hypothetical protein F4821DRAFT_281135 [Hypoxylon rubiginosum]|uniref:Uncharacterized protein n=1 Tax=Hypoxylon rubiginosum TaxID=110542 RepID=A0ACC0CRS2_9PEZI|nr:hypothetical protein F4821DRAFT_281135 [Hypoxylon rubiginosum]
MTKFSYLAPEIREMVWNAALYHEARSRFVIVHACGRPYIYKYLCSPFLSLNWESRQCALKFYSVKVNVACIESLGTEEDCLKLLAGCDAPWPTGYNSVNADPRLRRGVVYLSAEADNFIWDGLPGPEANIIPYMCFANGYPEDHIDFFVADPISVEDSAKIHTLYYVWDTWSKTAPVRLESHFRFANIQRHRTIWVGFDGWSNRRARLYQLPYIVKRLRQDMPTAFIDEITDPTAFIDEITDDAQPDVNNNNLAGFPRPASPPPVISDSSRSVEYCKWFLILKIAVDEARWVTSLPLPISAKIRLLQGFEGEARRWCDEYGIRYRYCSHN